MHVEPLHEFVGGVMRSLFVFLSTQDFRRINYCRMLTNAWGQKENLAQLVIKNASLIINFLIFFIFRIKNTTL